MKKKKEAPPPPRFESPFARLGELRHALPAGKSAPPPEPSRGPARAVVRMERKGRHGKEVTVVEQLDLAPEQREAWLKGLKAALGCGGAVEGERLVLQGDHRERLPALLEARGVRRIARG